MAEQYIQFRELMKKCVLFHGASVLEKVYLHLPDPLYNLRQGRQGDIFDHDRLSTNCLIDVVNFGKAVMKPESHGYTFCSVFRFGSWLRALAKEA